MDALAFPLRFVNQRPVRLDGNSEEYAAQMVASAIQTQFRELPITVDYGCHSAEFDAFDEANLYRTVANYFPGIIIDNVIQAVNKDETVSITVEFSIVRSI